MFYCDIKRIIDSVKDQYSELKNSSLTLHKYLVDVVYLHIADNMLSRNFLRFLFDSDIKFDIFPSYSDSYSFDIQIELDEYITTNN